jgi:hypothetical protein
MSLVHHTLVGHFDPKQVHPGNLVFARPIDLDRAIRLLADYPDKVAARVRFRAGTLLAFGRGEGT